MPGRINIDEKEIERLGPEARQKLRETADDTDHQVDDIKEDVKEDTRIDDDFESKRYDWKKDADGKKSDYESKRYDWAKDVDMSKERESIISQDIRRAKGVASKVGGLISRANHKYGPGVQKFKSGVAKEVSVRPRTSRRLPATSRRGRVSVGKVQRSNIGYGTPVVDRPGQQQQQGGVGINTDFLLGRGGVYGQGQHQGRYPVDSSPSFNPGFIFGNLPQPQMTKPKYNNNRKRDTAPGGFSVMPPTSGLNFNPNFIFGGVPKPNFNNMGLGNRAGQSSKKKKGKRKHR